MDLRTIERWLLPADMERNPRFQSDLFASSPMGLRMLGIMELAVPIFLFPFRGSGRLQLIVIMVGLLTVVSASLAGVRRHARLITLVSGWLAAATLMETALWASPAALLDDHILVGAISLLVFAVISAVPLIPMQTCFFGSAIGVLYAATAPAAGRWDSSQQIFILFLTCFATWASALLYTQKREAFEAHQRSLEIQETLTTAQSRAQLAETAMSLGRLAAALTHEINTPLGAMKSAVDTLQLLSRRQATAAPEDRERLARSQADLSRSVADSFDRLSSVVTRLKRLIALERDDKQTVSINDLLTNAGLMVQERLRPGIRLVWELRETPPVVCSTNQITTVFSNLLNNAIAAIEGEGEIVIASAAAGGMVEVTVADNGRGMDSDDVATIFDPGFRVEHGRVLGGNWSLFTARQIVNEHGGEIWMESQWGQGTTAHVSLPALR
ncbi:MAG: HAMP domain-containing histidine kinase [Acidobacteriota bacterium]|nr:HAMP domain-containing histidine kinase [Acidobacteriota bacterium]